MSCICIIPARGGSKGIFKKNIIEVGGKPLIAWSIIQAIESKFVDSVYVSTDDDEIAQVARKYDAKIIKRPASIATDTATSEEAISHALSEIEQARTVETIVFLQATSPIREKDDIDNAITLFKKEKYDSLLSCTKLEDYFIWERTENSSQSINYDYKNRKRRQDISPQYLENGSIYIFTPSILRKENNRLGGQIGIYEMDFWKSYQIDNTDDIDICDYYLYKRILNKRIKYV